MFDYMDEFRCSKCNKLFFRYKLNGNIKIEIKCTRCSRITVLTISEGGN